MSDLSRHEARYAEPPDEPEHDVDPCDYCKADPCRCDDIYDRYVDDLAERGLWPRR